MNQTRFDAFYKVMQEIFRSSDLLNEYDALPHPYGDYILYQKEAHIISLIGDTPGITAKEISQITSTTESACSQMIKKLLNKNWIYRSVSASNRRVNHLYLTDSGLNIYEQHRAWDERCYQLNYNHLENYSTDDFNFFLRLLRDINYSLAYGVEESKNFKLLSKANLKENSTCESLPAK